MTSSPFDPGAEFDRQLQVLLDKGYPDLAGLGEAQFRRQVRPLRDVALSGCAADGPAPREGRAPFVLVITEQWVAAERGVERTTLGGQPGKPRKPGFADFDPGDLARFRPIDGLAVPDRPAYLMFDVDRGADLCNVTPDDALVKITGAGRTPITVAEGVAFLTQYPDALRKNHCFSLVGSRCGDRRVPALWISGGAPKLGWCWAGNPHTWLGSASCAARAVAG